MTSVRLLLIVTFPFALAGSPLRAEPDTDSIVVRQPPDATIVRGYFKQYALDRLQSGPAIVAVDREDSVWIGLARSGQLARFSNGGLTLFPIGENSRPVGVVPDDTGNSAPGTIWIAAAFDNKIVRYNYFSGEKRIIDLSSQSAWPFMLALASDGSVWFTQRAANRIGHIDRETLNVTHYDVLTPGAGPAGLAIDPTNGHVWFSEGTADRIGELDPATGNVREYAMGSHATGMISGPAGIAVGPEGHVWFAKLEGMIGHIAPMSDSIELIPVPEDARRPAGIVVGPSGHVWALALDGNCILQYRPDEKSYTLYPMPSGSIDLQPSAPPLSRTSRPFGLAFDSQGNLWVSEQYTGQLAVLDVAAPTVEILSPTAEVDLADPLLTLRALDRVSGVQDIRVDIDGEPARVSNGRVMLTHILPGEHILKVTAQDAAGLEGVATLEFNYRPSRLAAQTAVSTLQPLDTTGSRLQADILDDMRNGGSGDAWRDVFLVAADLLRRNADHFLDATAVPVIVEVAALSAVERVVIEVLDSPPYFSRARVNVPVGAWITWTYDPPLQEHRLLSGSHSLRIAHGERPSVLRAGESFSRQFEEPGVFVIKDEQQPNAETVVEVVAQ